MARAHGRYQESPVVTVFSPELFLSHSEWTFMVLEGLVQRAGGRGPGRGGQRGEREGGDQGVQQFG